MRDHKDQSNIISVEEYNFLTDALKTGTQTMTRLAKKHVEAVGYLAWGITAPTKKEMLEYLSKALAVLRNDGDDDYKNNCSWLTVDKAKKKGIDIHQEPIKEHKMNLVLNDFGQHFINEAPPKFSRPTINNLEQLWVDK
jgi:hypothetical protein